MTIADVTGMPRERLVALGSAALTDAELVAIQLGTGGRGEDVLTLARRLLTEFNGLRGLSNAQVDELANMNGVRQAKACRLVSAFALADRVTTDSAPTTILSSAENAD